jgi:hypothetical protein
MQKGDPGVVALLTVNLLGALETIAIEVSQAHVGTLAVAGQEVLAEAIKEQGGAVTCAAKLRRLNYGDTYQLLLDVKLPIEIQEN